MDDLEKYGLTPELPDTFDHSFSGTYEECNRMGYYQGVLGRRLDRDDAYALLWGSVFHKIAEVWVPNRNIQEVLDIVSTNIPDDVDDYYGRNQGRMQEAFLEWVKFRELNPLEVLYNEQAVVIDCRSKCPYSETGCDLRYGGKIDQIVRWNNLIGPLDYKTTTREEDDPVAEYNPSHQMEGYTWLTGHLLQRHCWGAIIERLIINKSKIRVGRFPVSYTRDQIKEWVENERLIQQEIREKFAAHSHNQTAWKQNYARCRAPQRACRYRDVCLSPKSFNFRLKWLRDNTHEERFDFQKKKELSDGTE